MAIDVKESAASAASWAKREFIEDALRPAVAAADILMVPQEGYGIQRPDLRYFAAGSAELFTFLQQRVPEGVRVEACCDDNDFREVTRHADIIYICDFVVKGVFAPLLVGLIMEWVRQKVGTKRVESTTIKATLTVHDESTGRSLQITYDGPAEQFSETILGKTGEMRAAGQDPRATQTNEQPEHDSDIPPKLPSAG